MLYLIDPEAALFNIYPEMTDFLKRLFISDPRNLKYFSYLDDNQIAPHEMKDLVMRDKEQVMPNSFGPIVMDHSNFDFVARRVPINQDANYEYHRNRIKERKELFWGTMANLLQYFADIGGFDAILDLIRMGVPEENEE